MNNLFCGIGIHQWNYEKPEVIKQPRVLLRGPGAGTEFYVDIVKQVGECRVCGRKIVRKVNQ